MNHRLQSLVNGTVLAIAFGRLLYIGRDIQVPVVFSVLAVSYTHLDVYKRQAPGRG